MTRRKPKAKPGNWVLLDPDMVHEHFDMEVMIEKLLRPQRVVGSYMGGTKNQRIYELERPGTNDGVAFMGVWGHEIVRVFESEYDVLLWKMGVLR